MDSTTESLTAALRPMVAVIPADEGHPEQAAREEQLRMLVHSILWTVGEAHYAAQVRGIEDVPDALEALHEGTGLPGYLVAAAMVRGSLESQEPGQWRGWLEPARDLLAGMATFGAPDGTGVARGDRNVFASAMVAEAGNVLAEYAGYETRELPADMPERDRLTCLFAVQSAAHAVGRSGADRQEVGHLLRRIADMRGHLGDPEFE